MTENPLLRTYYTAKTYKGWIDSAFITDQLREQIQSANVLLVPRFGYGDLSEELNFPLGTQELFTFLGEAKTPDLKVDICIEDNDYKELLLHADEVHLASIVLTFIVAPLLVNLLTEYLKQRFGSRYSKGKVICNLTLYEEEDKPGIHIHYDGPAMDFNKVISDAIDNFEDLKNSAQAMKDDY